MFHRNQLPYDRTFTFEGAQINYHVIGNGKPVIFIHGFFTNCSPYKETLESLGRSFKVYALDLPGFGASDTVDGRRHNFELFSEVLSAFIALHNLSSAPIIALSFGGISAIKSALNGDTRGKLIFVAAPGKPHKGILTKILTRLPMQIRRKLISTRWGRRTLVIPTAIINTGTNAIETHEFRYKNISHTASESIADIEYVEDFKNYELEIASVKNQMAFVYGEKDRMKHERIDFIKQYIEVPDVGHNIFIHAPAETVAILRRLL